MRNGFGLIAGSLALALAAASAYSAPPGTTTVKVSPNAAADIGKLPRPKSARQSLPPGVSQFSGQECHDLGGVINLDTAGVCASGQLCKRVDNQGQEHRMCITVGQ